MITDDEIFKEVSKLVELDFEVTRTVLFFDGGIDFSVRTHKTNAFVIKFFNHKYLTWF